MGVLVCRLGVAGSSEVWGEGPWVEERMQCPQARDLPREQVKTICLELAVEGGKTWWPVALLQHSEKDEMYRSDVVISFRMSRSQGRDFFKGDCRD